MMKQNHPLLEQAINDFQLRNKPYDIQIGFMNDMLKCYEDEKIGFFESPTGTGKSLSVICASIAFLRDRNAEFLNKRKSYNDDNDSDSESSDICLDDDDDDNKKAKPSHLLICTRTHSQIKELIVEFQNLKKAAENLRLNSNHSLKSLEAQVIKGEKGLNEEILKFKKEAIFANEYLKKFPRCVSLASRQHLCVNSELKKLSAAELNDRCNSKCSFYNENDFKSFSHHIHEAPMDIEDLCKYGESRHICPYYSCRQAISKSDIILLPYQTLFQQTTRETLDMSLDNSYIVVDEAHNLVDALNSLYTVTINVEEIDLTCSKLLAYRAKIARQPKGDKVLAESTQRDRQIDIKNISALYQVLFSIRKVCNINEEKVVLTMNEFQINNKIKVGNTFSLINWAKESKIVYKCCHSEKEEDRVSSTEAFRKCLSFIEMMGNTDDLGNVVFDKKILSYLLLNPSTVFTEVSSKAKSIVLVGGTLQPLEDVIFQLTQFSQPEKILTHCNGHVIPKENCLCLCAQKGPNNTETFFDYNHRDLQSSLITICEAVTDLAARVPHGIIVFFTSKKYMMKVHEFISTKGYMSKINDFNKFLLCESSEQNQLDLIMRTYKSHIDNNAGAVLFAVINGKLSEGINFANDYCRCVMVVGMPYPDSRDIVLKQRMEFFNQKAKENKTKCDGQMFYENLCMRAVNQSIGRSFRNINDYAVVVLFDNRYKDHSNNLPGWIQRSYHNVSTWNKIDEMIDDFFKRKKST